MSIMVPFSANQFEKNDLVLTYGLLIEENGMYQVTLQGPRSSRGALWDTEKWPRRVRASGLHRLFPAGLTQAGLPVPNSLLDRVALAVVLD